MQTKDSFMFGSISKFVSDTQKAIQGPEKEEFTLKSVV